MMRSFQELTPHDCSVAAKAVCADTLERAARICAVAAPTDYEEGRAAMVAQLLQSRGLQTTVDDMHNVVARLRSPSLGGRSDQSTLMISAHLDTVFPPGTPLEVTRTETTMTGPGVGDNSLAVACMVALVDMLAQLQVDLPVDLLLVANVGEEGLGNLRGMRQVVNHYRHELLGAIVLEGHGLGGVIHQGVGSIRIKVTIHAPGGHSWHHFGVPSAIHVLGEVVSQIGRIRLSAEPRTTFNVGLIQGGTTVNTIAAQASAVIDMRSICPDALAQLDAQIRGIIKQQCTGPVDAQVEVLGARPAGATPVQTDLVKRAVTVLEQMGLAPVLKAASTDANIPIAMGIPSICIGMTTGRGMHTLTETIDLPPVAKGLEQLLRLVLAIARPVDSLV